MKKTIILMLALVLTLSVFVFTACDERNTAAIVFNENMTLDDALAAVHADSEYEGYTFYRETYDEDGNVYYYWLTTYISDDFGCYVVSTSSSQYKDELQIWDFKESNWYIIEPEGLGIKVTYGPLTQEHASDSKEQTTYCRDEVIKDFFNSMQDGCELKTDCEKSEGVSAHFTTSIEGTALTYTCDCGKCKYVYKDFNASYSLPEKYSNYKSIAKLYVAED